MITHMVVFKFKDGTPTQVIDDIETHMGRLPGIISEIQHYAFGRDVVRSDRSYDFGLISQFADMEALQRYQVHPDHQALVEKLRAACANIIAVDYTTPA